MIINPNLSCNEIDSQINMCYEDSNIIYGSSETFFIGSVNAVDYLFDMSVQIKNGKIYHDDIWQDNSFVDFASTMDLALYQWKATYSPEIQYIAHMYYSNFCYKNMRVDFNNPHSSFNKTCMYHVRLDPNRK